MNREELVDKLERLADWVIDQETDEITANYEAIIYDLWDALKKYKEMERRLRAWLVVEIKNIDNVEPVDGDISHCLEALEEG